MGHAVDLAKHQSGLAQDDQHHQEQLGHEQGIASDQNDLAREQTAQKPKPNGGSS
jgi:hypothetical protein